MRIAFVPIDNRPVCYDLAKMISHIDETIDFLLPEREDLGSLTESANIEHLFNWLKNIEAPDVIILSLDTLAYGGLIPSRRCPESFEQIKTRIDKLKEILKSKNAKIYAFSSIMRISHNNYNEEEKEYWADYGEKIFEFSFEFHKNGKTKSDVPDEILQDYIKTRNRNFEINKIYLEWQKQGLLDTLIYSKDDCAPYGLNVIEAQELEKLGGYIKTGADEIPLSLMSRAIKGSVKICPIFTQPEQKHLISNYEDISIEDCVKGQIELANCEITDEQNADILLYVNNFKDHQGEIVMKIETEVFDEEFITPEKPYMIADVRFANGSDNNFVRKFFHNKIEDKNFYGYSGWNTSANTLGSLICCAKTKFLSKKYNLNAFKNVQITRFLDDWAYQANIRQTQNEPNIEELTKRIKPYEDIVREMIEKDFKVKYSYPWNRLFEVKIELS